MSFMTIQPDMLAVAASDLSLIGSALTAAQFVAHAGRYQAVSAQAAAVHRMFVSTLGASAASYAAAEGANAITVS
jgi:PE family